MLTGMAYRFRIELPGFSISRNEVSRRAFIEARSAATSTSGPQETIARFGALPAGWHVVDAMSPDLTLAEHRGSWPAPCTYDLAAVASAAAGSTRSEESIAEGALFGGGPADLVIHLCAGGRR